MGKSLLLIFLFGCARTSIQEKNTESVLIHPKPIVKKVIAGATHPNNNFFNDKTKDYGLDNVIATHFYAVDFNNDSWTDLVLLPNFYSIPQFFAFDSAKKKFQRVASPFSESLRASFLVFADFNKDGIQDVLLATLNQKTELTQYPLRIFKGILKDKVLSYAEVPAAFPNNVLPTTTLVPFDFNLDGELDLYQGNWFDFKKHSPTPVNDIVLLGKKFKFKKINILASLYKHKKSDFRPTFGAALCDIDNNGWPDIVTASASGFANRLWVNKFSLQHGRLFTDYGRSSGFAMDNEGTGALAGGHSSFAICHDYNNDGIVDVLVGELSHAYDAESRDRSSVLTGAAKYFPPKFIRTEYHMDDGTARWNQEDRRGVWVDLNFDGRLDILVDNSGFPPGSRLVAFLQENDHSFTDVSEDWGLNIVNPVGTIVLDINRDGRPDILTGQTNIRNSTIAKRVYLFENVMPRQGKRSLRVFLKGKKSNSSGLGATITLYSTEQRQSRLVSYNEGPQSSQHALGLIFGLDKGDKIKKITVRWPYLSPENRQKNKNPPLQTYSLKNISFLENQNLYLCESGKWSKSAKINCE